MTDPTPKLGHPWYSREEGDAFAIDAKRAWADTGVQSTHAADVTALDEEMRRIGGDTGNTILAVVPAMWWNEYYKLHGRWEFNGYRIYWRAGEAR